MAECNTQRTPNLLLIYGQHPDFKVVRSYERWREEHRSVKAGEHGITYMISTEYEKDGEMRRGYTIGKDLTSVRCQESHWKNALSEA